MSLSRNQAIIIAITRTGITTSQAANKFNMSTRQIRRIVAAWKTQGQAGITPRSRAPHTNPNTTPQHVKNQILALRETLKTEVTLHLWTPELAGLVPA
uniref:helix-turn-helix domain-containing protein n=1 Tax=Vaginimicrobium propionicum TaxID=1871034 RepID=UPI0009710518|nr:helix-turn-helix domain-containing protein [Vaginimicrobium propionicum]